MDGMEGSDVFESPGEALLFLAGVPAIGLFFAGFVVWVAGGVSSRGLVPVFGLMQVGMLLQAGIERRVIGRRYPGVPWREARRRSRSLREELWRWETVRSAAGLVARDVSGAVRGALRDELLTPRRVGQGVLVVAATMAVMLAVS
jgi:hypothetical protein